MLEHTQQQSDEIQALKNRITELEQAVHQSNRDLEENIQTLKSTQHQLIQTAKLDTIGQLTAGLAHELNQPLGRILLTAELAASKLGNDDDEKHNAVKQKLESIIKDVNRASTLIKHLRMYSHQDIASNKEPVGLSELIDEALVLFSHLIKKHDIDCSVEFAHNNHTLVADGTQIEQVFCNLLTNAIDAMSDCQKKRLKITTKADSQQVTITFEDSGVGMPESISQNMFDPFFTTKPSGKGMGLGLSISKGIIENHGGQIEVDSEVDKGTRISVTLPLEQA